MRGIVNGGVGKEYSPGSRLRLAGFMQAECGHGIFDNAHVLAGVQVDCTDDGFDAGSEHLAGNGTDVSRVGNNVVSKSNTTRSIGEPGIAADG